MGRQGIPQGKTQGKFETACIGLILTPNQGLTPISFFFSALKCGYAGEQKSGVPCRDVRACVCVCARTHQANRDHASPAAGFEILPRPSTKNPWSSDLKPLESFYAEINFSIIEGVLGKGSACQPPCRHGLLMARRTSEMVGCRVEKWSGGCWWCDLSAGVKSKPMLSILQRGRTLLHGPSPA